MGFSPLPFFELNISQLCNISSLLYDSINVSLIVYSDNFFIDDSISESVFFILFKYFLINSVIIFFNNFPFSIILLYNVISEFSPDYLFFFISSIWVVASPINIFKSSIYFFSTSIESTSVLYLCWRYTKDDWVVSLGWDIRLLFINLFIYKYF